MASESRVQSLVRLEGPRFDVKLWRNNVGVLTDKDGRPVRYGLANDSKELNKVLKSSDLIGWRTVTVTPDMVGRKVAIFVARECKPEGWRFTGTDRELAQQNWIALVNQDGGDAAFATGEGTFK